MKTLQSILKVLAAFLVMFVILPGIFIYLNSLFNLPVYHSTLLKILGWIFLALGLSIVSNCAYVLFVKPGQFIPAPTNTPKKFIVDGFYRYVRNPMYLGDFIVILSIFMLLGHLLLAVYFVLAVIFVNIMVIFKEEKTLEQSFGAEYLFYKSEVPRWFPKIKKS